MVNGISYGRKSSRDMLLFATDLFSPTPNPLINNGQSISPWSLNTLCTIQNVGVCPHCSLLCNLQMYGPVVLKNIIIFTQCSL